MKKILFLFLGMTLFACADFVFLEDYPIIHSNPSFNDQAVRTVAVNGFTLKATGQIDSLGDGIVEYGHVWTEGVNTPPNYEEWNRNSKTDLTSPGAFTIQLDAELIEYGKSYVIRTYGVDVHGKEIYGSPLVFERNYTFETEILEMEANIAIINFTLPIIEIDDGSLIASGTAWFQNGTSNRLIKINPDGSIDENFSTGPNSVLKNWFYEAPVDMLEIGNEIVVIGEHDGDNGCFNNGEGINKLDGSNGNTYWVSFSEDFPNSQCIKILPLNSLGIGFARVVCTGWNEDPWASQIFVKELNINPGSVNCLQNDNTEDLYEAKDAIIGINNEIIIAGVDNKENGRIFLSKEYTPNEPNYLDQNTYLSVKVGYASNAENPYLVVAVIDDGAGFAAIEVDENLNEVNTTVFQNLDGIGFSQVLFLDDGSFILGGTKNETAYLSKYVKENGSYQAQWARNNFNGWEIAGMTSTSDGGIAAAARKGKVFTVIKTDDLGIIY